MSKINKYKYIVCQMVTGAGAEGSRRRGQGVLGLAGEEWFGKYK